MNATTATLENFETPGERNEYDDEIVRISIRLRELRAEKGELPAQFPDLTLEKQKLSDESESILNKVWKGVKKAFDFLVVKPIKWIGRQIKEHPIRTILIALAAFALWYYSAPLSAGLSAIKEEGVAVTSELLEKSLAIDPTRIDVFDQLVKPGTPPIS